MQASFYESFKIKIPFNFRMFPAFNQIYLQKHELRIIIHKKLIENLKNKKILKYHLVPQQIIHEENKTTLKSFSRIQQISKNQKYLTIKYDNSLSLDENSNYFGFYVTLLLDKNSSTLVAKINKEVAKFDSYKLDKVKLVKSDKLQNILDNIKVNKNLIDSGLLSMDRKQRFLVQDWNTNLPAVGLWIQGPVQINSLFVYTKLLEYLKCETKQKCTFQYKNCKQINLIMILFNQDNPEGHFLSLTDYKLIKYQQAKRIDKNQEEFEFKTDNQVSGMQFTLRDKTIHNSIDFYSPIKSLETQAFQNQFSKISEKNHNSPQFIRYDNEKQEMAKRINQQQKLITMMQQQLKKMEIRLKKAEQRSPIKQSFIRSPQYEYWSSVRKVITPDKLQQSDLKIQSDSKGSTNTTKRSQTFIQDGVQFRKARKVIMQEQQQPWDHIQLIE